MRSTLKHRSVAIVATFAVAFGLVACGGGGGGDSIATVPIPAPAPVATEPSWNNAPISASAGTEAAKQLAASAPFRGTAQTYSTDPYAGVDLLNAIEQLLDFGERAFPQYFPDHRATSVIEKIRFRYYPTNGVYLGVAYGVTAGDGLVESGVYVMGGEFGNSPTHVGMLLDFIVPTKPMQIVQWYDPPVTATITPMYRWVVGANRLPAGCIEIDQPCWKESVQNGTVKFIDTSATMVGLSNGRDTRPVVTAYYITADGTRWNTLPVYRDTGESTGSSIDGGGTFVVDRVYGNELGVIFEALGSCWQKKWYPAGDPSGNANIWTNEKVVCP